MKLSKEIKSLTCIMRWRYRFLRKRRRKAISGSLWGRRDSREGRATSSFWVSAKYTHTHTIIIMKNFNKHSSHGHHGSNAANRRNTHTHMDHTHSLTLNTSTQLQPICAKCQLCYYRIWNLFSFFLKVPEVHNMVYSMMTWPIKINQSLKSSYKVNQRSRKITE